jgi:CRP-like cAMP-binding protein
METRNELLTTGARLRSADLFTGLSDAEAAILGSCMERIEAAEGETVVRQGEAGGALYLIEEGEADVIRRGPRGGTRTVARLGPGTYFGEISIITGGERIADVMAATPMILQRLSEADYVLYLAGIADIEQSVTRTALTRADAAARAGSSPESP